MVLLVEEGLLKPYMDNAGIVWVKSGAYKRRVTAREELQRVFQASNLVHADETPVKGANMDQVDLLPTVSIKAVCYPGTDVHADAYVDSEDITGKLELQYRNAMSFISRNLHHVQNGQSVNSTGVLEISKTALEEILVNALVHRGYFASAHIRLFVFSDRVEVISPDNLPNNLTIDKIKAGNSVIRNPVIASFLSKSLPYRGLGNGIRRALKAHPAILFEDDREGNQFKVTLLRTKQNQVTE